MRLMKALISLLLLCSLSPEVRASDCGVTLWNEMGQEQRANQLSDLDYFASELPACLKALSFDELKLLAHEEYASKIIAKFHESVDREGIEQSDYLIETGPELSSAYLLLSDQGVILGGVVSFYQAGLDQDGNEADISWSASARFDSSGELLRDENGSEIDDLYYEWSGH